MPIKEKGKVLFMKALVTGANGQSSSYLVELLLEKGYDVIGVVRRSSTNTLGRLTTAMKNPNLKIITGDITDLSSVFSFLSSERPDQIYNLGAMSHVGVSFEQPIQTWRSVAEGCLNMLEGMRMFCPEARFYQASSSEQFGSSFSIDENTGEKYQSEDTPFKPQSPYAIAKVAAHNSVNLYRKAYGLHASCGILFNHESPRRGLNFVTRKITHHLGQIHKTAQYEKSTSKLYPTSNEKLRLGNLHSYRDWGHAKDYVRAMYLMLQQDEPDDYVVCTGETHTVEQFLAQAFEYAGFGDYRPHVVIDPALIRPSEVDYLRGCCLKAKQVLGWEPQYNFLSLCKEMVAEDLRWS